MSGPPASTPYTQPGGTAVSSAGINTHRDWLNFHRNFHGFLGQQITTMQAFTAATQAVVNLDAVGFDTEGGSITNGWQCPWDGYWRVGGRIHLPAGTGSMNLSVFDLHGTTDAALLSTDGALHPSYPVTLAVPPEPIYISALDHVTLRFICSANVTAALASGGAATLSISWAGQ